MNLWPYLPPVPKRLARVRAEFFNWGNQVAIRRITPLRLSYDKSYAKAFPFDKMVSDMLDPEMIEDTAKIVNEATKDKIRVNLITNSRAGGPPLLAQKISQILHSEKKQKGLRSC